MNLSPQAATHIQTVHLKRIHTDGFKGTVEQFMFKEQEKVITY